MPNWLYQYFQDIIKPMLVTKDGRKLEKPAAYKDYGPHSPPSFWIHPPEPVFDLSSTGSIRYPCTVPVFTFGFPTTSLTICAVQSVGVTSLRNKGPFPLDAFFISRMCSTSSHGHTTADMDAGLTSKGGARHSWSPSLNTFVFHSRPSFRIKVDSPIGL